jgi:flagellin
MIINHNIGAMGASRNLFINNFHGDRDLEKLSSGLKINRGADDAAGLSVSEKMRAQVRGLNMARRNAQDGVSLIQTAEGFLQEVTSALQRVRELSVQAANGVYEPEDRKYIQTEVKQLLEEVQRISDQAEFNKKKLFNDPNLQSKETTLDASKGAASTDPAATAPAAAPESEKPGIVVHIGPNMDHREWVTIDMMTLDALGIAMKKEGVSDTKNLVDVTTTENANRSIAVIDKALERVNKQRTDLGAFQNRLETAMRGIEIASENISAAESRIRDTDMGAQMIDFVKNSILSQAATSMLAQANLRPQMILRVLG